MTLDILPLLGGGGGSGGVVGHDFANIQARNRVLSTNPPVAPNNITSHGSSWLWAVMAIHSVLFLFVLALTLRIKHRERVYHYIALAILLVPTIAYFTMASNLSGVGVRVEFRRGRSREVFWVRFVEWTITWMLTVLALLLMTAVGWSTVLFTMGLAALYAIMFLSGAYTPTSYKWGYFVLAIMAYVLLVYQLLCVARPWARRYETSKWYFPLAAYILFFWALYPISWGLSEGGNVISNDGECVFYGILDILSKGLFAVALAFVAERLDLKSLGLWMHDHGRIAPGYGGGGGGGEDGLGGGGGGGGGGGAQDKGKPGGGAGGDAAAGTVRDSGVAYDTYGPGTGSAVPGTAGSAEGAAPAMTTTTAATTAAPV